MNEAMPAPDGGQRWCGVCGIRHAERARCRGRLLATGPERRGRRLAVEIGGRPEVVGVLVAEAGDVWRARLLTEPNMLWTVPGGRCTMKFVASTAQEAEARAVEYLRELCASRGYEIHDGSPPAAGTALPDPERGPGTPRAASDTRVPRAATVRYGRDEATEVAQTIDVSPGGLSIATREPLPRGTSLTLALEIQGYTIPLSGVIAWSRELPRAGRPPGMGVRLTHPPALYVRIARELASGAGGDDPDSDGATTAD